MSCTGVRSVTITSMEMDGESWNTMQSSRLINEMLLLKKKTVRMETSLKYTYLVHFSVHNGHEDNQEKYNDGTHDIKRVFEEGPPPTRPPL